MDKQRLAELAKNSGHPAVGPELLRLLVAAVLELAGDDSDAAEPASVKAAPYWLAELREDLGREPTKEDLVDYGASVGVELQMSMLKAEMVDAIDAKS